MANAEFKKSVIAKIRRARSEGITFGEMEEACPDGITVHTICNLLNAQVYPIEVWEAVDKVMDDLMKA
jgi:hypothetical protein